MAKSYLGQGFNVARKTVNKKKSNIVTFMFSSIASSLGKIFLIFRPFFQMYDLNISKNAVLYNEIDMISGVKDIDDIKANISLHLINIIKVLLFVSLVIVLCIFLGLITSLGNILQQLSELNIFVFAVGIPIIIIGIAIALTIDAFFTPAAYVAIKSEDKSLFSILSTCKNSVRISSLVKITLYNLLYLLVVIGIPCIVVLLCINVEQSLITTIFLIIGILVYLFIFAFAKLVRDTTIFLLISSRVVFEDVNEMKKYEKSEEELLANLFNK